MVDNRHDVLVSIAKKYYLEGKTQQQISDEMHISRSNISRLLTECIKQGIIEFHINETTSAGFDLRNELVSRTTLKNCLVVPSKATADETKTALGNAVAAYLSKIIQTGMLVGVCWGTTVYQVARAMYKNEMLKTDCIQLVGGVGADSPDTNGYEITRMVAGKLGGHAFFAFIPYMVQDTRLKTIIMKEHDTMEYFERMKNIDIAVVGIGSSEYTMSSSVKAGYITKDMLTEMVNGGAVADVCGMQINRNGKMCAIEFNRHRIGISENDLRNIPSVIGVACGREKVPAISAAMKSGLIDILAVDEETAKELLQKEYR